MIKAQNIIKSFDGHTILNDISVQFEAGQTNLIIGRSGSGKTVLLKCLVGLHDVDQGAIYYDDVCFSKLDFKARKAIRRDVGMIFQGGALLGWLTVEENVALPLREHGGLSEDEIDARVSEALAAVELSDAADRYPAEISGGMQKRAGLARAIVRRNDIILYDEPTSGLDPVTSVTINRLIRRLNRERGITSIVVTHDLQGALLFADRILMLKSGHVVELSAPETFVRSTNPEVREFLDAQFITPDLLEKKL